MAVRRVVAAIDVVINGQRNLDRLAQTYAQIDRASQAAVRSIRTYQVNVMGAVRASDQFSRAIGLNVSQQTRLAVATAQTARGINNLMNATRQAGAGFMGFVNAIQRGRERLDAQGRTTRGLTDNIISLTRSMLLFSVMLPLVQLPQRAIESFGDFIRVGAEWQDQMRVSNALLRQNEEQFAALSAEVGKVAINYNVTTQSMRQLFQTASSSVSAIKANEQQLGEMGQAAYDAHVALKLTEQSARLAFATGTDAAQATTTLIQTLATYGVEVERAAEISDSLFAITDIGTAKFEELEHTLPRVTAAMGPLIARYADADDKLNVMNESFAVFAALTQRMPVEQAATSFANVFKDISQMTGKQKELVTSWERIRKAQGLGPEQSLDPTALLRTGNPAEAFLQLRQIFDLQGPMIEAYVQNQRRMGSMADDATLRSVGQMQLMQAYFEDMRAVRGFQLLTPESLQAQREAFNRERPGSVEQGIQQMRKSFVQASGSMREAWQQIQTAMFTSIEPQLAGGANVITDIFKRLLDNTDFKSGDFLTKLRILGTTLMTEFSNWFQGGGRGQIQTVGKDIGTFIGNAVTAFFKGGKDNVLIEAGRAFSEAFIEGIAQTLPELLGAVLTSAITRGLATALSIRYMTKGRMPNSLSYALSLGGAFSTETARESDNPITSMAGGGLGTLLMAGAGAAALKGFWSARQPVATAGARTVGGAFRNIRNAILNRNANPAYTRGSFPITGPGWPGFGTIARRGAAGGGNALLALAMGIPEIMGAENERDKWASIGGTIGGVGGGILGGALGAAAGGVGGIAGGLLGSMALGGLGNWAGGSLYDMFHPGTGKGGVEAPERAALAETFAVGFDTSLAVPLLTQIRDVLIRSGGGTIGGFSSAPAASTTSGATQGTGRGLEASFVNQIDTTQLTAAQAAAACGPAAAAFFARAYGRNPTLKEAYTLVSNIQGGAPDAPGVGGTRGVNTLGVALNQMGIQSAVYQGSNIDWGRLAENATQGIPGIVNIGPNPATKFPGHYFQIGGYNAETNQFNVGASGTVLRGGKSMMTPEEMMALGPKYGAIYGLGRTGAEGTGQGSITEADIAAIPTSAGTGTGPGGGGGVVTVNIQNMMNVEHMDGSTDIRSLMGQMAEILRQLSTGGSVVGQSGVIAP